MAGTDGAGPSRGGPGSPGPQPGRRRRHPGPPRPAIHRECRPPGSHRRYRRPRPHRWIRLRWRPTAGDRWERGPPPGHRLQPHRPRPRSPARPYRPPVLPVGPGPGPRAPSSRPGRVPPVPGVPAPAPPPGRSTGRWRRPGWSPRPRTRSRRDPRADGGGATASGRCRLPPRLPPPDRPECPGRPRAPGRTTARTGGRRRSPHPDAHPERVQRRIAKPYPPYGQSRRSRTGRAVIGRD